MSHVEAMLSADLRQLLDQILAEGTPTGKPLPNEQVELLERLLGKPACRRMGIFALPEGFRLSVVIPVYNEVKTVGEVIRRVRACGVPVEIILVEHGSCSIAGVASPICKSSSTSKTRVKGPPCALAFSKPPAKW